MLPAALLSGTAAAAGSALVNSIGNLGGFVGPYLFGLMKDATRVAHDPAVERARRPSDRFSRKPRVATAPKRVRPVA